MYKITASLIIAAVACFGAAIMSRVLGYRIYSPFTFGQYLDLTTIFLLGAILTTLREQNAKSNAKGKMQSEK